METVAEAVNSLAYSLLGLIIGFVLGRATKEVHEIKEKIVEPDHHPQHEKPSRKQGQGVMKSRTLGVMLIVLALLTVLMSSLTAVQDRAQSDCFRRYNVAFGKAFSERAKAADADRASLNKMLTAINTPDQATRARVYQQYLDELAQTDKQRKANPLPQPPDAAKFCT